MSTVLANCRP
uniref:Uncharacterized protein n=1 Tax=Romanomermis culicivorax TaxID=13658 RepID=A0A915L202_ROMCU